MSHNEYHFYIRCVLYFLEKNKHAEQTLSMFLQKPITWPSMIFKQNKWERNGKIKKWKGGHPWESCQTQLDVLLSTSSFFLSVIRTVNTFN